MKTFVASLFAIAWCVTASAVEPAKGFATASLNIGYMPDAELGRRVTVPELTGYIKKLEAECTGFFASTNTPENLDIVVAVKPGKVSRVWFISSRIPLAAEKRDQLRAKLEGVAAPDVSGGAIAFAIEGKVAGGDPKSPKKTGAPPVPAGWKDALTKQDHAMQFDEMLATVWPDSPASAKQAFKVPEGVKYKEATAAVNEQAKQLLLKKFSAKSTDKDVLSIFTTKLICGPGLWSEIKDDKEMAKLTKGNVNIHVDAQTLDGKLFQSPEEVMLFWKAFVKVVDTGSFKVRKLSEEEIKIFWAMISFDIEEPLYILESPQHKILVDFVSDGGLKIMWIDDFQGLRMKPKTP